METLTTTEIIVLAIMMAFMLVMSIIESKSMNKKGKQLWKKELQKL